MEHQEIEQHQIVERYLAGRLLAGEAEQFEEHYLSCPRCLEELELSEAFRDGIRRVATEDALKVAVVRKLGALAWFTRSRQAALWAAVALVAVGLPLALTVYQRGELRERSVELAQARAPQQNTLLLALSPERSGLGEAPAARISLPTSPGWIVLSLELEQPEIDGYRVQLFDSTGENLWTGDDLQPNHRDSLTVSLHSSFLGEGDYVLQVDGIPLTGDPIPVGRFAFRVLPASR